MMMLFRPSLYIPLKRLIKTRFVDRMLRGLNLFSYLCTQNVYYEGIPECLAALCATL